MIRKINTNEFNEYILNNKELALVDFYAEWCGPCRMLGPVIEGISEEITNVKFYKLDVDSDMDIAYKYKINSIPCLILFKDGEVVDKSLGFKPYDDLIEWIKNNI